MPPTDAELAQRAHGFRALHAGGCFVIPNPWDAGSAKLFAGLGFPALATTSAGAAFARGVPDGGLGRDDILANARALVEAVDLPVSADLLQGFGDAPETVAETIGMAAAVGLAGGSIEDTTGRATDPMYPIDLAVARIEAAVVAAKAAEAATGRPFVLTARADGLLVGACDLAEVVRRLQAYQSAGAEVLYAPALPDRAAVEAVLGAIDRPLNVLPGRTGLTVTDLAAIGVRRISLGSSLFGAAFAAASAAARTIRDAGRFDFAATPYPEMTRVMTCDRPA